MGSEGKLCGICAGYVPNYELVSERVTTTSPKSFDFFPVIHLFIQKTFIENLLCARQNRICSDTKIYQTQSHPQVIYSLLGTQLLKTNLGNINSSIYKTFKNINGKNN